MKTIIIIDDTENIQAKRTAALLVLHHYENKNTIPEKGIKNAVGFVYDNYKGLIYRNKDTVTITFENLKQ